MSFTVYTKDNCRYCIMVKSFLDERGMEYEEIKIPDDASKEDVQIRVKASGSDRNIATVPQVFDGDRYIGGARELGLHLKQIDNQ